MTRIGTWYRLAFVALAGSAIAALSGVLAVSGPPYYRGPWVVGLALETLTLPALLVQELYPASWHIKYTASAVIVTNGLCYAIMTSVILTIVRAVRKSGKRNGQGAQQSLGEPQG